MSALSHRAQKLLLLIGVDVVYNNVRTAVLLDIKQQKVLS